MTTKDEVLASLDPKTRKRLQLADSIKIEKLPTPSIGLNLALRGGIGYGRQTLIWGNKSAGKSSLCLQMLGDAQRAGKVVAWIDSEQSYDPSWADRLGAVSADVIYSATKSVANAANYGVELIQGGVDILVLDSISSILASSYFDDEEIKEFEKTGQIGTQAKDLGKLQNMWNGVNEKTAIIMISQHRNKITPVFTKLGPMGGEGMKFNSSTIIKLFSSESDAKALTAKIAAGDRLYDEKVGRKVMWDVEFNKLGPSGPSGEYDFYFLGSKVGVDSDGELVDLAEHYGIIQKNKAWWEYNGDSKYRKDWIAAVSEDDSLKQKLIGELDVFLR